MRDAVDAIHLRMDPRPLVGLTEADRGTTVERVLMQTALDIAAQEARAAHAEAVAASQS